ncbi:MAG TPA: flagellar protein FlaG [Bacillota bacterium]|nr:flagellar protein FlaG [Bacillota bacterium]HPT88561.1 flagellar protein FlaG [Bacillota bacterium]
MRVERSLLGAYPSEGSGKTEYAKSLNPSAASIKDEAAHNASDELAEKAFNKNADDRNIDEKLEQLNQTAELFNKAIRFDKHEETGRTIIRVVNTENDEVISEIPPQKILDILARIEQTIGLLFDEKV